jgi:hypothetical protein
MNQVLDGNSPARIWGVQGSQDLACFPQDFYQDILILYPELGYKYSNAGGNAMPLLQLKQF